MLFLEKESRFFRFRPSQKLFTPLLFQSFLISLFLHILFFSLFQPQLSPLVEDPYSITSAPVTVCLSHTTTSVRTPSVQNNEGPKIPNASLFFIEEESLLLPDDEDPHLEDLVITNYQDFTHLSYKILP